MNGSEHDNSVAISERVNTLCSQRQQLLARRLGLVVEDSPGDLPGQATRPTQLIAWIRPTPDANFQAEEPSGRWRDFLKQQLPAYMIPSRFPVVTQIPRLANGKIDRSALHLPSPSTESQAAKPEEELIGPVEIMQRIWCDVLQAEEVYPEDDFFELGGDSLMSINVVARARDEGVLLKPSELFDFPRLSELCAHIAEESREQEISGAAASGEQLRSRNVEGSLRPFFMVHGGARLLARLRDSLGPEQPIHLLAAHWEEGGLDRGISMDELAEEALGVLLEIQPEGPYSIGGFSFGAVIAYEIARRLIAQQQSVEMLFMLDPPENPEVFHSVPAHCRSIQRQGASTTGGDKQRPRLRPTQALSFAAGKLQNHMLHYMLRLALDARHAYAVACHELGYPVPPSLRKLYVFRRYLAAASRYSLEPIDCPIILYRASRGYYKWGTALWQAMADGGLTVEEFDCEHDDLQWQPEIVAQWTRQFGSQFNLHNRPTTSAELADAGS